MFCSNAVERVAQLTLRACNAIKGHRDPGQPVILLYSIRRTLTRHIYSHVHMTLTASCLQPTIALATNNRS
jgi:hypothetical protein